VKLIAGLGNPDPEHDATRHNVGWWMADRLAHDWKLSGFRRQGPALVSEGAAAGDAVRVIKPLTYMNRSGAALRPWMGREDLRVSGDILVVVDDASLEAGRVRFRPKGGAGGHNGLRSVEATLGTQDYNRLRIGVGRAPEGADLADWVLSPMGAEDEDRVLELLPELTGAVELWIREGIEAAMNQFNR
jgi:peptidyl-tRNA hydrolase, PTH1 family